MLQINKHFYLKEHYMAIWDNLQCHNTRLPLGHTTMLTEPAFGMQETKREQKNKQNIN